MPKLQHILPILFTWLSLWLAVGPLTALFISISADSSGLIPELSSFAALLLCAVSVAETCCSMLAGLHTQTHTRLLYVFPQLLVFYHFFTVTPLHHSFTPTLPLCRCVRVSGSWPAGKWAGWDSHGAHAHMKATAVRTKTQWSNRKINKTNNDSVTFHPIQSAFTLETFLDPHVAIFCCSGLLWYYINANC